jgi:alcohol dehydrogenase (cytochrome c)
MNVKRRGLLAGACFAALLVAGVAGSAYAADYTPVTDARLANPEPGNWLMTRGNYKGWSYSALDQINSSNVKNLVPVWSFSTGVDSGHESPPIVNNGVMFVTTPYSQVIALDAATGDFLWRYKRPLPEGFSALHNTNRGVALYGDKVYFAPLDATVVALDAKTGKVAWEAKIEDWKQGYYTTMAPLIVKGKVLVGVAGGEFGVRGFVQAFDAQTGKSAWKTYTVPAPGEPGSDTWKKADTWKTGGASTWMTGNYDPDTNTVYWGTGNGSPWFGDQRPGDNLYTSSTVALDGDTGKIKGHFQYHQNESWDWDEMNAPMLVDFQKDGTTTKGLLKPARNGYLYWLKRDTDGSIAYLKSQGTCRRMSSPVSTRRPAGLKSTWRTSRRPASPRSSAPAFGVAKTGHTRPTIRRRVLSTFRPMKTTATRSKAKSKSVSRGNGGLASPSRTSTSRSTRRRPSLAKSRPSRSIPASESGGICTRAP